MRGLALVVLVGVLIAAAMPPGLRAALSGPVSGAVALVCALLGLWLWRRGRPVPDWYWPEELASLALFWRAHEDGSPMTLHGHLAAAPAYPEGHADYAVLRVAPLANYGPPVRVLVRDAAELRARALAARDFVAVKGHLAWALGPPVRGRFRRRAWFLARAADIEASRSPVEEQVPA